MADDAAGAVRRTPRPAPKPPAAWWSPTEGFWSTNDGPVEGLRVLDFADEFRAYPPPDAVQLVGPDQRRPVVLLRADDCDCGPPYADCEHGPEPVDALDLAVWLHAESEHHRAWLLKAGALELASHTQAEDKLTAELEAVRQHARNVAAQRDVENLAYIGAAAERDELQARIDAALALIDYWDACGGSIPQGHRLRAALQGDQPEVRSG